MHNHCELCEVFVSDCDYTLWNGSLSDDGLYGLNISAPHMELQKKLSDLQEAGNYGTIWHHEKQWFDVLW